MCRDPLYVSAEARRSGSDDRGEIEAAELLRRLLARVEAGELDAPATVIAYLEGALSALESLPPGKTS